MGTFLTGPLLTASSQSVPSIFHLPSVSQESRLNVSLLAVTSQVFVSEQRVTPSEFFYLSDFMNLGNMIHVCVLRLNPPCGLQPQIRSEGVDVEVCRQLFVMSSGQFTVRP